MLVERMGYLSLGRGVGYGVGVFEISVSRGI